MSQQKHKMQDCQKLRNLTGTPADCSPEQIRECHGESGVHPCVESEGCEHPERLQNKPGECSPEQIRQCHGNSAGHPCE